MALTILDIISPGLADQLDLKKAPERPVEFRLVNAGRVDPTSSRKVATPQAWITPGQDMIRDPHDKNTREKLIMNITGYNPIKGKPGEATYMDPIVDYVRFGDSGSIFVQPEDNNLYLFLKLHNKNRDNPNRKPGKEVKFFEVDEKKEVAVKNNQFIYTTLAGGLLLDLDTDQINALAIKVQKAYKEKYAFNLTKEPDEILAQLQSIARNNPVDLILGMGDPASTARVLVDDAVNRKLLFFDDHAEKLNWAWKRSAFEKGRKAIVKLTAGNNPVKGLVDFLVTAEGNEHLLELKQGYQEYYRTR